MNLRFLNLGMLAGMVSVSAVSGADRLADVSPFLPQGRNEAPVVTENPPLELRGIVGQGADRMFNIYNPSTKQSAWVTLNQAGQNFQVRSFDEGADTVSLDYAGKAVVLKLAQAKIAPMAEIRPPPSNAGPPSINVQSAVIPRQPTPEQQRALENVAAEVERRRQLRNQRQQEPQKN